MRNRIGIFAAGALIGAAAMYLLNTPKGRELKQKAGKKILEVLDAVETGISGKETAGNINNGEGL